MTFRTRQLPLPLADFGFPRHSLAVPRVCYAPKLGSLEGRRKDQVTTACKFGYALRLMYLCSFGKHFSFSGDHTESIEIQYDPKTTSYSQMLKLFWRNHDPTRCASRQYMSAIFYHNSEQKKLAEDSKEEEQKKLSRKIVTKIAPAETFYDAEK